MKPDTVYFRPDRPSPPQDILAMGREYFADDEVDTSDDSDLFAPGDLDGESFEDAMLRLENALRPCPDAPEPEPFLLTVKQAAKRFNIGERTIYRMIENGLPVSRAGKAVRIKPSDLAKRMEYEGTRLR